MNYCSRLGTWPGFIAVVALLVGVTASPSAAQGPPAVVKGQRLRELLSPTGYAALMHVRAARAVGRRALLPPGEEEEEGSVIPKDNFVTAEPEPDDAPFGSGGREGRGFGRNQRFQNVFVNDPCLDPPPYAPFPENFLRTVQSETEIAVLNKVPRDKDSGDSKKDKDEGKGGGRLLVAGYNDSWGFYNNRQGLSGYAYSTDGGNSWIDGGGLPPIVKSGAEAGTPGSDAYFGDPVVQVHHRSKTFYYASIYLTSAGIFTIAVNRGHFAVAPPQNPVEPESKSNTRCAKNPAKWGVPDPPGLIRERIIWEPPVVAVPIEGTEDDFIDKEWLYVDQLTGELYLAYLRGAADGSTPLELTRSKDGGHTWLGPTVIVPNLNDTFNTGVSVVTTMTGRVIVSWFARTFALIAPDFPEIAQRIESAYSDDDGVTFSRPVLVSNVNPQGEPPGYNRERDQILNVTYLAVDKGKYDGAAKDKGRSKRAGYGNVYVSYFSGKTTFATPPAENPPFARAANIYVSRSTTNGASWRPRVKVNDDRTETSHVFPSVQVNQDGVVFTTWIDRRVDPSRNLSSDTWGDVSRTQGRSFDGDVRLTDVSTDWFARADAAPNFGDYNSSEVINFKYFASIWADGRFPKPAPLTPTEDEGYTRPADEAATPDTFFEIFGDGGGRGGDHGHGDDKD